MCCYCISKILHAKSFTTEQKVFSSRSPVGRKRDTIDAHIRIHKVEEEDTTLVPLLFTLGPLYDPVSTELTNWPCGEGSSP